MKKRLKYPCSLQHAELIKNAENEMLNDIHEVEYIVFCDLCGVETRYRKRSNESR